MVSDTLITSAETLIRKIDECVPFINASFMNNQARTGSAYSGPTFGAELNALRQCIAEIRRQEPQKITFYMENDVKKVLLDKDLCRVDVDIPVLDLSMTGISYTYGSIPRTDIVADDGGISKLLVEIRTNTSSNHVVLELDNPIPTFKIVYSPIHGKTGLRYLSYESIIVEPKAYLSHEKSKYHLPVPLKVQLQGSINIQTGVMSVSGSVDLYTPDGPQPTSRSFYSASKIELIGYEPRLFYDKGI